MRTFLAAITASLCSFCCLAQPAARVKSIFPADVKVFGNINYAGDTSHFHLLDVYLPPHATKSLPLVVWIHGGAWMLNDKYADMSYMRETVKGFIDSGYALASIDYRYSTTAKFPAQIQDCNQAIQFLYDNAAKFHIDKNRIALIGFSAGGHLASLLGLSNNNNIPSFFHDGKKPAFKVRTVLDFYGPADLVSFSMGTDTSENNNRSSISLLLGAMGLHRPDLAKTASPVTYIDKNDPPFFIVQGEKDQSVPWTQSQLLYSWLQLAGVPATITIVSGAPHYGPMFDVPEIREKLFAQLRKYL
jgi:acetyl esterase/lipase